MECCLRCGKVASGVKYEISSSYADVVGSYHCHGGEHGHCRNDRPGSAVTRSPGLLQCTEIRRVEPQIVEVLATVVFPNIAAVQQHGGGFFFVVANITPGYSRTSWRLCPRRWMPVRRAVGCVFHRLLEAVTELFSRCWKRRSSLLPAALGGGAAVCYYHRERAESRICPLLIEAAVQLVSTLATSIADALPTLIFGSGAGYRHHS